MENLNEVITYGSETNFQFFVRLAEGEIKSMELPLKLKEEFLNRFGGEMPAITEYAQWLNEIQK